MMIVKMMVMLIVMGMLRVMIVKMMLTEAENDGDVNQ